MAERHNELTPQRERGLTRPGSSWSGHPFGTLQRFADEMDRFFEDFGFGRNWATPLGRSGAGEFAWAPSVDVHQKDDQVFIHADLPGLSKDDVSVEVTDNAVAIQGERKREHHDEQQGYYRSERSYGSFSRVIPLPEGALTDQAKATFRDGVLEITIPAPPSRGRKLQIGDAKSEPATATARK